MMKCMIVDDSPLATDLLEKYIGQVDALELVRKCTNAVEAIEVLNKTPVDIIFLDIQMPDITGIDLLRALKKKPVVIFTTAHPEYAVEGFELDATDYLLKPFSFERFMKAVNKAEAQLQPAKTTGMSETARPHIFVRSGYETVKVFTEDILYVEALRDYIRIVTPSGNTVSKMSMKEILAELPAEEFIRVHRSFIVSKNRITKVSAHRITVNKQEIPLGDVYRAAFMQEFGKK